jgi:hypothetical protein
VPFVQIVLKGYIPYYAPYSNYNADQKESLLRMIDYGAYPSFLLTNEPSSKLMDTPSQNIFTSEFSNWKNEVINQYQLVAKSLGQVEGETIISRDVLAPGVVKDTYSKGQSILINYTEKPFLDQDDHVKVEAKNVVVIDGKGKQ